MAYNRSYKAGGPKGLRLVSKRIAYCRPLLQAAFDSVSISVDPESNKNIEFSTHGRYVNTVSFEPPCYDDDLTWQMYCEIIKPLDPFKSCISGANDHHVMTVFDLNNEPPVEKDALQLGFDKYEATIKKTHELLTSDRLRSQWSAKLKALPNCHVVFFSGDQSEKGRDRLAAYQSELTISAAIDSLAKAETQILEMHIKCVLTGQSHWAQLPGWDGLDLSQMHTLKVEPHITFDKEGETTGDFSANSLTPIFKKCGSTLVNFTLVNFTWGGYSRWMNWPSDEVVALPKLEYLRFGSGVIRPSNFKDWMEHMQSLRFLALDSTKCGYSGYKYIFDALRDHMEKNKPTEMKLEFDSLPVCGWTELSLYHDLANIDDDVLNLDETDYDAYSDIDKMLIRYMVSLTDWDNPSTAEWFPLWQ